MKTQHEMTEEEFLNLLATAIAPLIEWCNQLIEDLGNLFADIAFVLSDFFDAFQAFQKAVEWQRQEGESLTDWGNRLDRAGLLDNPEIRWEYQKACWHSVFHALSVPFRYIIKKLASVVENSF